MSLLSRQLTVTITLGTGNFGEGTGNTVTLTGYRVSATIQKFGQPGIDAAEIRIYGLPLTQMNQLSRLGKPLAYPRTNQISVTAGAVGQGQALVYSGIMFTTYADFDGEPDACLVVTAFYDLTNTATPSAPLSFPGAASVAVIAQQIAGQMNLSFVNEGVKQVVNNQYLTGSTKQQLDKLAEAGNFQYITNGGSGQTSLVIWPKGQSQGAMGPEIGPESGMVGYPRYSDAGMVVKSLYIPGLAIGSPFTLKSSLTGAVGTWFVLSLTLDLECNNPTGGNDWFMEIEAQRASLAS